MMHHSSLTSFVAGTALGILVSSGWFLHSFPSLWSVPPAAPSPAPSRSTASSGAISVNNQAAGSIVFIESVTVSPPGVWIAVREVNGGELGNILGAARVGGPRSPVSIPLLRATQPEEQYAVELYRDDGTGTFDPTTHSVYVDFDTGERVVAYFKTH